MVDRALHAPLSTTIEFFCRQVGHSYGMMTKASDPERATFQYPLPPLKDMISSMASNSDLVASKIGKSRSFSQPLSGDRNSSGELLRLGI